MPLGALQRGLRVGAAERDHPDAVAVHGDEPGDRVGGVGGGDEVQPDVALAQPDGAYAVRPGGGLPGRLLRRRPGVGRAGVGRPGVGRAFIGHEAEVGTEAGCGLVGVRAVELDMGDGLDGQRVLPGGGE